MTKEEYIEHRIGLLETVVSNLIHHEMFLLGAGSDRHYFLETLLTQIAQSANELDEAYENSKTKHPLIPSPPSPPDKGILNEDVS